MGKITMHPAAVRRWGTKADDIGEDIWGQHRKVAAAGSENTPGVAFDVSDAFTTFFTTWSGVVSSLGTTIGTVGGNLKASAASVASHDGQSADDVDRCWDKSTGTHGPSARTPYYGQTERPEQPDRPRQPIGPRAPDLP